MHTTLGARTARRYAERFAWPIARGHYASEKQSVMPCCCGAKLASEAADCSCGNSRCAAPGCHPVADDWLVEASSDPEEVARLWGGGTWWPIAATGIAFDAVVVEGPLPSSTLTQALANAYSLGLTLTWRDSWHAFLTMPGELDPDAAGWPDEVSVRGTGSWIPLPAVALRSPARWLSGLTESGVPVLNSAEAVLSLLQAEAQCEARCEAAR